jgi:3-isopropylmalate/(R)-2-methylmalate dehydratase small subunit
MEKFATHIGIVAPIDRVNVDTDQVIPKQFLKLLTRQGYGKFLFYDWRYDGNDKPRPDFLLNQPRYQGSSILLARSNFGCGSSREHAAWAVLDYGFRVVIAPSFADIFYNNCFKNGLLPIALPESQVDELFRNTEATPGYKVTVDLPTQTIRDDQGLKFHFDIDPFRKQVLLEGLDDIGLTLKHSAEISAYESSHQPSAKLFGSVDYSQPAAK